MWFSMQYLPLAEATVITFLAPMLSGYLCDILLNDPFTRREQLASFIAIAGVVLIARPTSLFGGGHSDNGAMLPADQTNSTIIPEIPTVFARVVVGADHEPEAAPTQRLGAILVALVGVLGAAGAYTAIRCIGKRAHPLITVTYFSACSTVVSTFALLVGPSLGWHDMNFSGLLNISSAYEWFLLLSLGTCGFVMQFIMTAGLGGSDGRNANRATAMTYTHMLFAAGFDRWVFGHRMGVVSVVGCGLIVGSALWAALGKKTATPPLVSSGEGSGRRERGADVERDGRGGGEEALPMLNAGVGNEEEEEEEEEDEEEGEGRRSPRNHS
jgi:drug/metabolite transporter (DMT)-like permease